MSVRYLEAFTRTIVEVQASPSGGSPSFLPRRGQASDFAFLSPHFSSTPNKSPQSNSSEEISGQTVNDKDSQGEVQDHLVSFSQISKENAGDFASLLADPLDALFFVCETHMLPNLFQAKEILATQWLDPPSFYAFGVFLDGRPAGLVTLDHWDPVSRRAEVGYALLPEMRGKGLSKILVFFYLVYCFGELNLRRIAASYLEGNVVSGKIMEELGFRPDGVLREYQRRGATYLDLHLYSFLQEEFYARYPLLRGQQGLTTSGSSELLDPSSSTEQALPGGAS